MSGNRGSLRREQIRKIQVGRIRISENDVCDRSGSETPDMTVSPLRAEPTRLPIRKSRPEFEECEIMGGARKNMSDHISSRGAHEKCKTFPRHPTTA
jgi:hypothetical protein